MFLSPRVTVIWSISSLDVCLRDGSRHSKFPCFLLRVPRSWLSSCTHVGLEGAHGALSAWLLRGSLGWEI